MSDNYIDFCRLSDGLLKMPVDENNQPDYSGVWTWREGGEVLFGGYASYCDSMNRFYAKAAARSAAIETTRPVWRKLVLGPGLFGLALLLLIALYGAQR